MRWAFSSVEGYPAIMQREVRYLVMWRYALMRRSTLQYCKMMFVTIWKVSSNEEERLQGCSVMGDFSNAEGYNQ